MWSALEEAAERVARSTKPQDVRQDALLSSVRGSFEVDVSSVTQYVCAGNLL